MKHSAYLFDLSTNLQGRTYFTLVKDYFITTFVIQLGFLAFALILIWSCHITQREDLGLKNQSKN
jgi:hypothetical protein